MKYQLGTRSKMNLRGVSPKLVSVVQEAIQLTSQDFTVIEGFRDMERQKELVAGGKSKTLNSRHLTGHAVDIAPYPISWDFDKFYPIADAVIKAARNQNVPVRWGGNWEVTDIRTWGSSAEELVKAYSGKFYDLPHFEIPRGFE